jgi:serine-type D-Ala-D-Ala endopeptidase (penicillin-binding protein 7)
MKQITLLLFLLFALTQPSLAASGDRAPIRIQSQHAMVVDELGTVIFEKNANTPAPIASITKLMTAMVALDANPPMDEVLTITDADQDLLKNSGSRLRIGASLTRGEMFTLALASSENRAAHALARYYPGGLSNFVRAMNHKAEQLGMHNSHFLDPTGLDPGNRSTASDLVKMVQAAYNYPLIRQASTTKETLVFPYSKGGPVKYQVTNRFVRSNDGNWQVLISKTGYIEEAGRCLVMTAKTAGRRLTIVLLNSSGKMSPYGDSNRIRKWLLDKDQKRVAQH